MFTLIHGKSTYHALDLKRNFIILSPTSQLHKYFVLIGTRISNDFHQVPEYHQTIKGIIFSNFCK